MNIWFSLKWVMLSKAVITTRCTQKLLPKWVRIALFGLYYSKQSHKVLYNLKSDTKRPTRVTVASFEWECDETAAFPKCWRDDMCQHATDVWARIENNTCGCFDWGPWGSGVSGQLPGLTDNTDGLYQRFSNCEAYIPRGGTEGEPWGKDTAWGERDRSISVFWKWQEASYCSLAADLAAYQHSQQLQQQQWLWHSADRGSYGTIKYLAWLKKFVSKSNLSTQTW